MTENIVVLEVGILVLGLLLGLGMFLSARAALRRQVQDAETRAERILSDARNRAEASARAQISEARETAAALKRTGETEAAARLAEAAVVEEQARAHEAAAERFVSETEIALEEARQKDADAARLAAEARADREAAREAQSQQASRLEEISGLTAEEARAELLRRVEGETRQEAARISSRIVGQARHEAHDSARRLALGALWRLAPREVHDPLASQVRLPDDDMKGRIIGREGRNIRTLELATGVDVIIDNTPGVILLSSYDPLRREVARLSLERLIEDGRIHPARIESVVEKVRAEIEGTVQGIGEAAAFEVGLTDVHPKILRLVGLLRFRTQRGGNLLSQSTETALIAGHMAAEIGVREMIARRAGLLHAIAFADDESKTGAAATVSAEIAARFGEPPEVVSAIASLAPGLEPESAEAALVGLARRISEARPGARKDNVATFIDRMRRLEEIAMSFPGVRLAYAVRGGKEMRVLVEAANLTDEETLALSRDLARRIEREINLPGDLRIVLIRETRAVDYAV